MKFLSGSTYNGFLIVLVLLLQNHSEQDLSLKQYTF